MAATSQANEQRTEAERRRFGRFETSMPAVSVRNDLAADRAATCHLELKDFSLGGLAAESRVRLKAGERLTLRLPSHGAHAPLRLTGRVKHCRRQDDRYQVGIEFCETDTEPSLSPFRQLPRLFSAARRWQQGDAERFDDRTDA